ncbi:hypothetical protein [Ferruginibacter profundus]
MNCKRIFIVILITTITVFHSCTDTAKEKTPSLYVNPAPVDLTAQLDSIQQKDSQSVLFIKLSLLNKTVVPLSYYSMTCSWTTGITCDNKDITPNQNICFSNWWIKEIIAPAQSHNYFLTAVTKGDQLKKNFRIGFNVVTDVVNDVDSIAHALSDMKHVVWSNVIQPAH